MMNIRNFIFRRLLSFFTLQTFNNFKDELKHIHLVDEGIENLLKKEKILFLM